MYLSTTWLKEFVNIDVDNRALADGLTLSGSHVESILTKDIHGVYAGHIISIAPHPDADRLRICQVDVGEQGMKQIVTAATNVQEGHTVPVALDGARLAGGMEIHDAPLRGVMSQGMMCSYEELGFTDKVIPKASEGGIMLFPEEVLPGTDVVELMALDEAVIEFEITPNRPDCLGVLGMAQETAATFDLPLHAPTPRPLPVGQCEISVEVETEGVCRYMGVLLEDVKVGPSPLWMQLRLMEAGMRPINNIVDTSNYVMLEYNQPLHAFDADEIAGNIVVRRGRKGETLVTLDDVTRQVTEEDLLIADREKILGFAGVMGGARGEVTDQTTRVFLESANFDDKRIRRTSKRLGLRTEASARFEKGLDPETAAVAAARFVRLLEAMGAAKLAGEAVDHYPHPVTQREIPLRPQRVCDLLGVELSSEAIIMLLNRLSFEVQSQGENLLVTVPTVRRDIEGEVDLVEEVGRLYGFHNIAPQKLQGELVEGGRSEKRQRSDRVEDLLVAMGYSQLLTYSFISPKQYDKLMLAEEDPIRDSLKILNPLGEDFSTMRRTQLGNLLEVIATNKKYGVESFKGFEVGHVFIAHDKTLKADPEERRTLSFGGYGIDFFDLKETLEVLLERMGIPNADFVRLEDHPTLHPGRSARLVIGGTHHGVLGQVHPLVAERFGLKGEVYVAEVDLEGLLPLMADRRQYVPSPKFPAVTRDLAVVVREDVMFADLKAIVKSVAGEWLERFGLFDIYRGDQVPTGHKSMAVSCTFRHPERTFKDEEIVAMMDELRHQMEERLNATWRV